MCGILGALGYVDEQILRAVVQANQQQAHRGPDASGVWQTALPMDAGVILAHRRLAILDLCPESNQPMVDPQSQLVLVYNGELYNYLEIRQELAKAGVAFRTRGDTEVLLKAYLHWGEACLSRFRGMFAFAIYDPARRQVFCARDRLGKKPLYYAEVHQPGQGKTLLVASEIRTLLATGLVARRMDRIGLATYLWNGFVSGPHTIVNGVRGLEPGVSMTIDLDSLEKKSTRYWSLPNTPASPCGEEQLRQELESSVKMRLISDVPVGIFLSGGIDSSAVAAIAARTAPANIRTFTLAFAEADFDESRYARAVARQIGSEHTEIQLTGGLFQQTLPDALASIDQPTFDAINTYFVSRAVRDSGVSVALAGTGGDELFGGYRSFRSLGTMRLASRLAAFLPAGLLKTVTQTLVQLKYGSASQVPPQVRWAKLEQIFQQQGKLLELYQLIYAIFTPEYIQQLTGGALPHHCYQGLSPAKEKRLRGLIHNNSVLRTTSKMELECFIGERLLPDIDAASMAVSLEVRVPLLDHVVIERTAAVHEKIRYYPLGQKQLLRKLALNHFEPTLFQRPKAGFVLPLEKWCRENLRDEMTALFTDPHRCASVGLEMAEVSRLWQAYQANAKGLYWSRIWALFVLLWWGRQHEVTL